MTMPIIGVRLVNEGTGAEGKGTGGDRVRSPAGAEDMTTAGRRPLDTVAGPPGPGQEATPASALMARLRAALRAAVRSARLPSQLISGDEAIGRITRTISTALMGRVKNRARSQLVLITDCMKLRSTIGPSTIPSTTGASGIPPFSNRKPSTPNTTIRPTSR